MSLFSIVEILPPREGFSPDAYGAVALCVRDFTQHSRFHAATTVVGTLQKPGFEGIAYQAVTPRKRWYEPHTRAYARALAEAISRTVPNAEPLLIEVHNRPLLLNHLARRTRHPLILYLHNDSIEMRGCRTPRQRQGLLNRVAGIFCVSEFVKTRFLQGVSDPENKVQCVYNGFDVPEFLLASPPLRHKQIAFAGRMTEEKGALLLAEALHRVLPRFPEWRAVLIGGRRHSPSVTLSAYEQRILSTLEPLGEQVEFAGFLPHAETLRHFHASEMVVVPSLWHESFGRTALEAMACGAAVISSGSGGLPEVTGDAALTLPAVTSAALAEALTRLMEDETLRHNYQQRGRERAERFRMAHCAARLDEARERAFSLWQRGNPA